MKIFNLSLPKCATTSMAKLAQLNGKRVCDGHWKDNKTNMLTTLAIEGLWNRVLEIVPYYDYFSDLPFGGTNFYRELLKQSDNNVSSLL